MRCSIVLAFFVMLETFAYGFSRSSSTWRPLTPIRSAMLRPENKPAAVSRFPSVPRGGATKVNASPYNTGTKCPATGFATVMASLWGTTGVLYILAKAIKRVLPIALEPFQGVAPALSQFELG
jgi:hypothetical protein